MNIGLLLGSVGDDFSSALCRGADRATRELGENLVIIPGKYIGIAPMDPTEQYEYQNNVLFTYGKSKSLDILIVCAATIGATLTAEQRAEFLRKFGNIPIVTVASKEGYPSVTFDNRSGLIKAMDYLIHTLGKKHFGMLSGMLANEDAKERYDVVKLFLEANQLEFGEKQVEFDLMYDWCSDSAGKLLDRNPDMEVLICTNDAMALGAYEEIKRRGLQVGQDIYVLGFDDIAAAVNADPPLATIHADAAMLGQQAVMSAYRYVSWQQEMNLQVQTTFVPRDSIGYYRTEEENEILQLAATMTPESDIDYVVSRVVPYIMRTPETVADIPKIREVLVGFYKLFLVMVLEDRVDERKTVEILRQFKFMVKEGVLDYLDITRFKSISELATFQAVERKHSKDDIRLIVQLNAQLDRKIYEYIQQKSQREVFERRNIGFDSAKIMRDTLMLNVDAEASYTTLLRDIWRLNVTRSYIYVFDRPIVHNPDDEWKIPEEMLLKAYSRDDKVYGVPRTKQRVKFDELFRNRYFDERDNSSYVVIDLYIGRRQYGILVCDLPCKHYSFADVLAYQFSAAVRIIQMSVHGREMNKEIESTKAILAEKHIDVKASGIQDSATGLFNRDGFLQHVDILIQKATPERSYLLTAFADVDYMGLINEKYGRDEGDLAILGAGSILQTVSEPGVVIGRVASDRFGMFMIVDNTDAVDTVRERFAQAIEQYNQNSGKNYRLSLSVGVSVCQYTEEFVLDDLLRQADDDLYLEKRKKNIFIG